MGVQNTLVGLLMSDTWVFPTDSELEDLLRNGVTCSRDGHTYCHADLSRWVCKKNLIDILVRISKVEKVKNQPAKLEPDLDSLGSDRSLEVHSICCSSQI